MGLDTVSPKMMAMLTLEDIDPYNEAQASEAQRAAIEAALQGGAPGAKDELRARR